VEDQSPQIISPFTRDTSTPLQPQSHFGLGDLALMHHWSLVTCLTFGSSAKVHLWQTAFPDLAFKHAFLMHGMLSLTALHIAYLNPTNTHPYILSAAHHHDMSLQGFRASMQQMSESNSGALFVNSSFIFLYAFISIRTLYRPEQDSYSAATRTSRVLGADWIPLIRGISAVLHPVYAHVRTGSLSLVFDMGNWDDVDPDQHSSVDDREIVHLQEIWEGQEHAEVYNEALYILRKLSAWVISLKGLQEGANVQTNLECAGPFLWVSTAPEQYFKLLQQRQPPALCIFACFGAIMHNFNQYWWAEGYGQNIVKVVDGCLGSYWTTYLEWPKKVVGLG
jgi:hypothetical protein